jgi:hypothetical protein
LTGTKWNTNKTTFCRNGKYWHKFRTTDKPRKNKVYDSGNCLKNNKIVHLNTKNYKFETLVNFKCLGVTHSFRTDFLNNTTRSIYRTNPLTKYYQPTSVHTRVTFVYLWQCTGYNLFCKVSLLYTSRMAERT